MGEIGYDAGDRGEPEYPEPHVHEWKAYARKLDAAVHYCQCECGERLTTAQIEEMLNAAEQQAKTIKEQHNEIASLKTQLHDAKARGGE